MTGVRKSFAAATLVALTAASPFAAEAAPARNIVLVHGAFADGSGWKGVADILTHDGYTVSVVQEPETSLADDVAATNRVLDCQTGPVVLVGHSYGGAVITEAGRNAHVASLVYVAAFAPDAGDRLGGLIAGKPGAATSIGPIGGGYLAIEPVRFPADFAADVPIATARFMAHSQIPIKAEIFGTPIADPAWKAKPAYGIVATHDRMINPDLERSMYAHAGARITEIVGSHAIYLSQPRAVAAVIERAARGTD